MGGEEFASFPIIRQLSATLERGDVWVRIVEFIEVSSTPHDLTMFGNGLGTAGIGGRPGEFAVRAMWISMILPGSPVR